MSSSEAVSRNGKCIVELIEPLKMPNKAVVELVEEIGSKNKLEIARAEGQTGQGKICPYCGSPLYHISLTNEYYCFVCKKYVA
jgi:hypothetical protein